MVRVCVNTELFSSSPFSFVCLTLNRLLKTKNRGCETCGCVYRDGVSVPQYKNALKQKRNKLSCEGLRPAFLCLTFLWSSPESWAGSFFSSPPHQPSLRLQFPKRLWPEPFIPRHSCCEPALRENNQEETNTSPLNALFLSGVEMDANLLKILHKII